MSHEDGKEVIKRPVSVLLAEGCTDEIFYKKVKTLHLEDCRVTVRDLHGLHNVTIKVIDKIIGLSTSETCTPPSLLSNMLLFIGT